MPDALKKFRLMQTGAFRDEMEMIRKYLPFITFATSFRSFQTFHHRFRKMFALFRKIDFFLKKVLISRDSLFRSPYNLY